MISKTVTNLFEEFDKITQILVQDELNKTKINSIEADLKLLKLWRQEIESDRQSIFVIGKTSAGKSAFHNFLLDVENEKEFIFKTSPGIQTGVIQTLQHCYHRDYAKAEIKILNNDEFNKLELPEFLDIEIIDQSIIIPLISIDQILFLRDEIMAYCIIKDDDEVSFNVRKAVAIINIHFPLKYFKEFIIVDTPGLGSGEPTTDATVKEYFKARSHILWFLNAQHRTLNDSIMLLNEEKNLLQSNLNKITFIGNKFDMLDLEQNENHNNIKVELVNTLNKALEGVLEETSLNNIRFTSFKKPNKKFGSTNTIDEIKELDLKFQLEKKEVKLDNIESFAFALNRVLEALKDKIISEKIGKISIKIKNLENRKSILTKEITTINSKIKYPQEARERLKREIMEIEKKDNLNTHAKYNQYLKNLQDSINKIGNQFGDMIRANFSGIPLVIVNAQFKNFKEIPEFSLKGKETTWKKYINDDELDGNKASLLKFVNEKIAAIDLLVNTLISNINTYVNSVNSEIKKINDQIALSQKDSNNAKYELKSIDEILEKIKTIKDLLIVDIESQIAEWSPKHTNETTASVLENFLQLNSLLDEHNVIAERLNYK